MQGRVPFRESGESGNDIADTEARRHAHPDEPAQFTALANTVLCLVQTRQDRLDPRQEFASGLGRHDGARGTRQQAGPKLGFEVGDDARGLRLRQHTSPWGDRKAAEPSNARITAKGEIVLDQIPEALAMMRCVIDAGYT